jgi:putative peptide zinc metalloprotease protein
MDDSMYSKAGKQNFWEHLNEKVDFASSKPRKVDGVVERRFESDREGVYYIIKNPLAGTYLKLTDKDYYLWKLMDGTNSVRDLVIAYFTEYKSFAFARVDSLIDQLRSNSFLSDQPVNTFGNLKNLMNKSLNHNTDKFWDFFLNKQFMLCNMDNYISKAYDMIGWIFFTKPMKILYLILSGFGTFFFIKQLNSGAYSILRMWDSYSLGLLTVLLIYTVIIMIHETAHAFAIKSYGRHVRGGGLVVYFGIPAFFVDTMDIWMEPRRARMAVSWAGPYSQLISGGFCATISAFFPGTFASSLLFRFAFFSYMSFFINITPLLELDGYFILIDWLEIPFLRQKSLAFVKKEFWQKILKRESFSKDEKIFTVFGILAGVWSVCAILIAIYLWERRILSAFNSGLEKSFLQWLYLIIIVMVFGVPLLVLLVMKSTSVIYSTFSWLANNKYLKLNSNLIIFLVGVSIFLAVVSFLMPEDIFQIYKDIFKLLLLVYALFFAIKNVLCYREGRLEETFRLLIAFVFFLLVADFMSAFLPQARITKMIYGAPATANMIAALYPAFRIGSYVSLILSISILAGKDFNLCQRKEKIITLLALVGSSLLVIVAVRWGLNSEDWYSDIVPLFSLLFPVILVSLAFALLIPTCFVYKRTEFLMAWLVLALALMWMSAASVLRFYGEADRWTSSFHVMSYSLLASAMFAHYIIYTRVRFSYTIRTSNTPTPGEFTPRYEDKQRLRIAFVSICEAVFAQIISIYGERITLYLQNKLNARAREAGWNLRSRNLEIRDNLSEDFNIISLSEIYRGFLSQMLDFTSDLAGNSFVEKSMQRAWDLLYWEEREIADEYLLSPLDRVKNLTEEFRTAKRNLLQILHGIALFSEISHEEVLHISSRLHTEKFRGGTDIVKQGDIGNKFYIIKSGRVAVSIRDKDDGSERVVAHLSEGDYFGEIALLADVPRTATCRALSSVETWVLSKRDFNRIVKRHLDLPEKLDRAVANITLLERMPLFRGTSYKKLNNIVSMLKYKKVPAGTLIIRQNESGDAFYIIKSGEVMVTAKSGPEDKIIAKLGAGEYFGEIALITRQPRIANVTAISETELLVLENPEFNAVVELISSDLKQAGSRRSLDTRRKLRSIENTT